MHTMLCSKLPNMRWKLLCMRVLHLWLHTDEGRNLRELQHSKLREMQHVQSQYLWPLPAWLWIQRHTKRMRAMQRFTVHRLQWQLHAVHRMQGWIRRKHDWHRFWYMYSLWRFLFKVQQRLYSLWRMRIRIFSQFTEWMLEMRYYQLQTLQTWSIYRPTNLYSL